MGTAYFSNFQVQLLHFERLEPVILPRELGTTRSTRVLWHVGAVAVTRELQPSGGTLDLHRIHQLPLPTCNDLLRLA